MHSQYTVYTDGSKTKSGTGSGYVIYKFNEIIHEDYQPLIETTTIFQAELIAIGDAVKYITKKRSLKPKYVKKFSDSRAALQALDSYDITSSTTLNTIQNFGSLNFFFGILGTSIFSEKLEPQIRNNWSRPT